MKHAILFLACAAAAVPAFAAPGPPADEQARIPFPRYGGVRNFRAVEDGVVYLQDARRAWYRAELAGPCQGLRWALRIGLDTRFGSMLERGSTLIVDGDRCTVTSLVRSAGPPPRD
jgi:hypothetical protein